MDRRKSIKALLVGTAATGVLIESCNPADKKAAPAATEKAVAVDQTRTPKELEEIKKLEAETYFTKEEMGTIAILADIIIPKDEVSGNATDAKVPDFIEFIVKDMPQHKVPMRGGLRWLQLESFKRFNKSFDDITEKQRLEIVDDIAYPKKVKPGLKAGAAFFTLMRNLTTTGFYTSEIGVKDLGYMGNRVNQWNGVPDDVLKQYNVAYTEKELKECVSFDKA